VTTAEVVPFALLGLLGLAAADGRMPRLYAIVKPLATASLFLVLAPRASESLRLGVSAGLLCAIAGDALLLRTTDRRFFYAGMACFALAHLTYTAALLRAAGSGAALGGGVGVVLFGTLTLVLEKRLIPRLSPRLRAPVVAYGVVLTGTAVAASAWLTNTAPLSASTGLFVGALLLYAGDAFYAFNRFIRRVRFGQSAGLVLYWGGQLALMLGVRLATT
jgi:uncharacterized membrane protein YhhN